MKRNVYMQAISQKTQSQELCRLCDCEEVVFCGYGEPTMALETLLAVSDYIHSHYPFRIRLNTNSLSDLIHNRSTAKEICSAVDGISISLNMPAGRNFCLSGSLITYLCGEGLSIEKVKSRTLNIDRFVLFKLWEKQL